MAENKPNATSIDYNAMHPYWEMIETILDGAPAMREAGVAYLPRFPKEPEDNYEYRRANAKFTNIFRDLVEGLAAKPFAREVELVEPNPRIEELAEDIDGQGNHLHVFAAQVFFHGIAFGLDWILVDHQTIPAGATAADERAMGARPYWLRVPAQRVLWVESTIINGHEEIVYAAIHETETERRGFEQVTFERVRILFREPLGEGVWAPARWQLWQKGEESENWSMVGEGAISIGVIPLVPFFSGRRKEGTWQYLPPMKDAAHLQIEHYQQETNLKAAKEQTAFPMLAANGIDAPDSADPVPVGPYAVLYSGRAGAGEQRGEWSYVEPGAQSLRFLADEVERTEQQLRELGRQPLTANTGNLTVITTAFAAAKGNSAVQAWALNLKDAIEQAFVFTEMWIGQPGLGTEVSVYTDFDVETDAIEGMKLVLGMYQAGLVSREASVVEAKRRNVLSPEYDADEDAPLLDDVSEPTEDEALAAFATAAE